MDENHQTPYSQPDMFPETLPRHAILYWQGVDRWYESGTLLPPTKEQLGAKIQPPISPRTLTRWRSKSPLLLGRWPPRKTDHRPWEGRNGTTANHEPGELRPLRRVRIAGYDDHGNIVPMLTYFDAQTGEFVRSSIDNKENV